MAGEPVAAALGAQEHDMQQLARNIVAAHKRVRCPACGPRERGSPAATQLDQLVRALPASEPLQEQLARIAALRSDLAASGAELEAELERAGAHAVPVREAAACDAHAPPPQPPPSSCCANSSLLPRTLRSAPAPHALSGDDDVLRTRQIKRAPPRPVSASASSSLNMRPL